MLKRLNLPYLGLYHLRHTFSIFAMRRGVSLKMISLSLGHRSTKVTQEHYIRMGNNNHDEMRREFEGISS